MSSPDRSRDELRRLASALCDGEISCAEAQRLESLATQSPEAREYFLRYVQLHAELAWMLEQVGPRAVPRPEQALPRARRRRTAARWTGIALAVAVVLLVGVIFALAILLGPAPARHRSVEPTVAATVTRSVDAKWSGDTAPEGEGADLVAGQLLRLESGLAQISFHSGAKVILDGCKREVHFQVFSTSGGEIQLGRLAATVPPRASGFTIRTPSATITDLGTEIGVDVQGRGISEVHVFSGEVQVRPGGLSDASSPRDFSAGRAVSVALAGGRAQQVQAVSLASGAFQRTLPPRGPVERLRGLVAGDPRLLHHYPFEGQRREDRCADRWSGLDLDEVRMHGGAGGPDIYESAPGLDIYTTAIRPFRKDNTVGVALQSQAQFEPFRKLTVELLLILEDSTAPTDAIVASAVAFRANPPGAGALGVASDRGRLVFCLGRSAPEGAAPAVLEPGHWYYVAATFEARGGQTRINGYLADLTQGDGQLIQVAQDLVLEGTPAPGPLGIGKGFDRNGADAYPWSGRLDEIAIYGAVLDRQTLERRLAALVNKP